MNRIVIVGCFCLSILGQSCSSASADEVDFRSNWKGSANRTWVGSNFWANPLQDWRVQDGRLECVTSGPNRNVQLLTYQLTPKSQAAISVRLTRPSEGFDGWVGFRFASHGLFDDYRHAAIYGKGINAGWSTDNKLLLADQQADVETQLEPSFDGTLTLRLSLTSEAGTHRAILELVDDQNRILGKVEASLDSRDIYGNLVLVCHSNKPRQRTRVAYANAAPIVTFTDLQVSGANLSGGAEQAWGPVLWCQYTLSQGTLKLSAQFPPLGPQDSKDARLQVLRGDDWETVATATIDPLAQLALFRVEDWTASEDVPYRVLYSFENQESTYEGTIKHDPVDKAEIVVAGFTGNKDYAFPNREIVANVEKLKTDLLFFSGDQLYETNGGYGIVRTPLQPAILDYLHKWYLFGWSFGDLLRNQPSVHLPDDHDVYQGNIWGQGGRAAKRFEDGGYIMDPLWVNMVQRTQTAHLPDPYDPKPVQQGIGVYYTDLRCGRVSFAVLEDRKFKTGPSSRPGIVKNSAPASLLGPRQMSFLRDWAADWSHCDMKATLSQTVFAQCHTHGGKENSAMGRDTDANGWPQAARNRALREIRKGFAFMYAGDNHLPTVAHHGIDDWEDAGVSFTVPSIAAGFPRAWWPAQPGSNRAQGAPEYTGRTLSPWGHPLTMLAAANPEAFVPHRDTTPGDLRLLQDKSSGFGLVRFNTDTRQITIECWKLLADPSDPDTAQYGDWPITIDQEMNYGRRAKAWLPTVEVSGLEDPVVQVIQQSPHEILYTLRINGQTFRPKVFETGSYTLRVGDGVDRWQTQSDVRSLAEVRDETIAFQFE